MDAVELLLAAGVDVNVKNRVRTCRRGSPARGHLTTLVWLVCCQAGFSALMCAAMHGNIDTLEILVTWRRDPFARLHSIRTKAVSASDIDKGTCIDLNETCRVSAAHTLHPVRK